MASERRVGGTGTGEGVATTRLSRRERWRAARQRGMRAAKKGIIALMGPGLITGASDNDPAGIGTYSQTGAAFGYGLLWVMPLTIPLMAAFQEICARIGRVTGRGLARNLRLYYPVWLVGPIVGILAINNIISLGADINAMGDAVSLIFGGPRAVYAVGFTVLSLVLQTFCSFKQYTGILKYMAMVMPVYLVAAILLHPPWGEVLRATFLPSIGLGPGTLVMLVAVLGAAMSPYLFFWQASLESEDAKIAPGEEPLRKAPEVARKEFRRIRVDTYVGMVLSSLIAYSIIVCTATTLHAHGTMDVSSAAQAAEALKPVSPPVEVFGHRIEIAALLFSLGIVGGGMLAMPVLAGSTAYAIGELFHWPVGLERKPWRARGFYGVLVASTLLGAMMPLLPINPMRALVLAATANGITAVPIMIMIMLLFSNRRIMGHFTRVSRVLRAVGWVATGVMTAAVVATVCWWVKK